MGKARAWVGVVGLALAQWLVLPAMADAPNPPASPPERVWTIAVHHTGTLDPAAWKGFSDQQQKASEAQLKILSRHAFGESDFNMKLDETPHFLIYYQVFNREDADHAIGHYLEQAYTNLVQLFNLRPTRDEQGSGQGTDVWRGKAVIYVTTNSSEADALLSLLHSPHSISTPCVTLNGDGSVDAVLCRGRYGLTDYRQAVMAMTVGFLYRVHSPTPLPAWLESGLPAALADSMHYDAVNNFGQPQPPANPLAHAQAIAGDDLALMDLDALLDEEHPKYPDFSVYESLVAYMLQKNHARFGAFAMDIKDGKNWKDCLQPKFGWDPKRLETSFRAALPGAR